MKQIFLSFLLMSITIISFANERKNKSLIFENEVIQHTISFDDNKMIPSIYCKQTGTDLLLKESGIPWFEFVINRQLVNSLQPVWKYLKHEEKKLDNGGKEIILQIEGLKHLKGLIIEIHKQYFPSSPLTREMLYLKSQGNKTFTLNKYNGKLHFVFPQYAFADQNLSNRLLETRIATYAQEILPDYQTGYTWDQRKQSQVNNLAYCHMFAPDSLEYTMQADSIVLTKGPFQTIEMNGYTLFTAYEHASQDTRRGFQGMYQPTSTKEQFSNDAAQGVSGVNDLEATDQSLWFIGMETNKKKNHLEVSVKVIRGGYLENEKIDTKHPYETVWTAFAFYQNPVTTQEVIHQYLMEQITSHKPARIPHYYYNTWGMQRTSSDLRGVFTEDRIKEEIGYAAGLGVDLFVMDDGWEVAQGVWTPNERLSNGIKSLVEEIKRNGMIPGIWLSPMGISAQAERYKAHPEWVIRDRNGNPIKGQWDQPVFDFVSDFYDVFVEDCKKLIDQGIRFFKWDAINSFPSSLAGLRHGDETYTAQERKDRYDYLFPFYVTRAMRELREYNPEVLVEIDLTEPQRCMIGLMALQEGKFFWMNNGASGYGDYSTYRTKSMRTIVNRYAGLLPAGIFTFAVYPHNSHPFYAQRYNVNTSLIAGRGFWGDLKLMREDQRQMVYSTVSKSKRVLPHIYSLPTQVQGRIGSSPEIYTCINPDNAYGQVIAFSGSALAYNNRVTVNVKHFLGVLNHAYSLSGNTLNIPFQFAMPDDSREVFILSNDGTGISILSSSGWIDNIQLCSKSLLITMGSDSKFTIQIPSGYTGIKINGEQTNLETHNGFQLIHYTAKSSQTIEITWQ